MSAGTGSGFLRKFTGASPEASGRRRENVVNLGIQYISSLSS